MNGPRHYKEAAACLATAGASDLGSDRERYHLESAQVHATLALACAVLDAAYGRLSIPADQTWSDAFSAVEIDE